MEVDRRALEDDFPFEEPPLCTSMIVGKRVEIDDHSTHGDALAMTHETAGVETEVRAMAPDVVPNCARSAFCFCFFRPSRLQNCSFLIGRTNVLELRTCN